MHSPRRRPAPRRGFTMIELMVVVIIIAILIALLVPAVNAVRTTAIEAGVKAELSQFEQAIAQFKSVYGMEPPSRLVLCEKASDWSGTSTTNTRIDLANRQRSMAILRRMWPQFDFTKDREINGMGSSPADVLDLTAGECLVFFLAYAKYNSSTKQFVPQGFSKNPADPFATGGNREGPFLDFKVDRFTDTESNNGIDTNEKMPEYLDSFSGQKTPLLYFSSYEGKGYESLDWYGTAMSNGPYRQPRRTATDPYVYQKANGYQIISPGWDAAFGTGGPYDPDNAPSFKDSAGTFTDLPSNKAAMDNDEWDNITNFQGGRLKP